MGSDDPPTGGPLPRFPAEARAAQVHAFEALSGVLRPELWVDVDQLVRAAFLAGWHAGVGWRAAQPERRPARPARTARPA